MGLEMGLESLVHVIYISRGYGRRYLKHDVGSMGTHISARGPLMDFLFEMIVDTHISVEGDSIGWHMIFLTATTLQLSWTLTESENEHIHWPDTSVCLKCINSFKFQGAFAHQKNTSLVEFLVYYTFNMLPIGFLYALAIIQ